MKPWLKAAGIRAAKTFFQSLASLLTVGAALSELDWKYIVSVSIVAGIYSVAMSFAGLPETKIQVDAANKEGQ